MIRYLGLLLSLFSISSKRYLENRINTFANVMATAISIFITIIFINVIFTHTQTLNGWSQSQLLFLLGISRVLLSLYSALFQRSINRMPDYIRSGELDILLIKPLSAQFFLSFRLSRPFELFNAIAGFVLVAYALNQLDLVISTINVVALIVGLICGMVILYSIHYLLATLSIWIVNFYSLGVIFYLITNPLFLPTNIYGKTVSLVLTYIVPLGFIVMIPVQIFLNFSYSLLLIEIVLATILILLSILFWNFALRHYTSASS